MSHATDLQSDLFDSQQQVSDLKSIVRAIRPFALRWHDHMLDHLVEQAVKVTDPKCKATVWSLYEEYAAERKKLSAMLNAIEE